MAKRQAEDEQDGIDNPAAKRSRVDIADLLGSDGDVGDVSSATGAVQQADQHSVLQNLDKNAALVNSNEAVVDQHAEVGLGSNANTSQHSLAQVPANALVNTSKGPSQEGIIVYIAFMKHVQEENTYQDLLGVFSDVAKANEVVIKDFMNYYDPDDPDDGRLRHYGANGELFCSYQPHEYGENGMQFWVERHVVDDPTKKFKEAPDVAAEFDLAFADYDDEDDDEGDDAEDDANE